MKELTIEQKAKAYDEALKVLHKYDGANIMFTQDLKEEMFPELKEEDEDEKIRKAIIEHFAGSHSSMYPYKGFTKEQIITWLEKQDEDKKEINNFDVRPGLYKCIHRMFDGTPDGGLLFEIGNVYKCLSKHDRAEFEVSYGHSVYLEDPVVCKYFIPFEKQDEQKPIEWSEYDEHKIKNIIYFLKSAKKHYISDVEIDACVRWLWSLLQRMAM